ncbi:hypothetical protein ACSN7O_004632 [Enterobacter chuandaensis]
MLSRMTDSFTCEISPQQLRLTQGKRPICCVEREPQQSLEEALLSLLTVHCGGLPWFHSIRFLLSPSLVNHLVVPWASGISTPDELRDYATILAPKMFPRHASKALRFGFEDIHHGHNALMIMMDETLWQQLYRVTRTRKLRFHGVNTPMHSLLKTWSGALPETGVFALPEEAECTFACRSGGEWQQVYRIALPDIQTPQQLSLVSRLAGLPSTSCYYWHAEKGRMILPAQES